MVVLREQPQHSDQSEESEDTQDHQYPHSPPSFVADIVVVIAADDDNEGDAQGEGHKDDAEVQNVEPRFAAEEYLGSQGEYPEGHTDLTSTHKGEGGRKISQFCGQSLRDGQDHL